MMMRSIVKSILIYCAVAILGYGCEVLELSVDEREFFIAKEWKINTFIGNGKVITEEEIKADNPAHSLTNYRLIINEDFTFSRTDVSGATVSGTWSLISGASQLKLDIGGAVFESWIIIDLQIRRLELKFSGSNEVKPDGQNYQGQLDMIYVLEPVK